MSTFITILIIIASILLTLLVLVQNSKGGGLASGFSSGNQVMGAPKTADFLEKATWTLIGIIVFLSILSVAFTKKAKPAVEAEPEQPSLNATNPSETSTAAGEGNTVGMDGEPVNQGE